jgi:23S rRNA (cytosine1962-C5)-methyltransferase
VASSCSRPVAANEFYRIVSEVASGLNRPFREIERTTHALDHPIIFKEGAYLKSIFAVVG